MPMNMSYCRFENTYRALRECSAALSEAADPVSELRELADDFLPNED